MNGNSESRVSVKKTDVKVSWSIFPEVGPKLNQLYTKQLDGNVMQTEGFSFFERSQHIRVWVQTTKKIAALNRTIIDEFLGSVAVITSASERNPIYLYIDNIALSAGLQEFSCPKEIVQLMQTAAEAGGVTFLKSYCYVAKDIFENIKLRIESAQNQKNNAKKILWSQSAMGGYKCTEMHENNGAAWMIIPPNVFPPEYRPSAADTAGTIVTVNVVKY